MSAITTPRPPQAAQTDNKIKHLQTQAEEVQGIMRANIDLAINRGELLSSIEEKAEHLNGAALQFQKDAGKVKRRMWYKDMKLRLIIIAVVIILLLVIIVPVVLHTQKQTA